MERAGVTPIHFIIGKVKSGKVYYTPRIKNFNSRRPLIVVQKSIV